MLHSQCTGTELEIKFSIVFCTHYKHSVCAFRKTEQPFAILSLEEAYEVQFCQIIDHSRESVCLVLCDLEDIYASDVIMPAIFYSVM